MRTNLFALLLSILVLSSCKATPSGSKKGNGNIISKEIQVGDYNRITLASSGELIYEQKTNQKPYLRIEIDDNLKNNVMVSSKHGNLSISLNGNTNKFKIYTNSTSLSRIKTTGSGTILLKNDINSPDLDISVTGSGGIKADKLNCPNLGVSISGSGSINIGGNGYNCDYVISGSGTIDAYKLKAVNLTCRLSGSGVAKIYASESLDVRVSGSGGVSYKGSPKKIHKTLSGSGWLKPQ